MRSLSFVTDLSTTYQQTFDNKTFAWYPSSIGHKGRLYSYNPFATQTHSAWFLNFSKELQIVIGANEEFFNIKLPENMLEALRVYLINEQSYLQRTSEFACPHFMWSTF